MTHDTCGGESPRDSPIRVARGRRVGLRVIWSMTVEFGKRITFHYGSLCLAGSSCIEHDRTATTVLRHLERFLADIV